MLFVCLNLENMRYSPGNSVLIMWVYLHIMLISHTPESKTASKSLMMVIDEVGDQTGAPQAVLDFIWIPFTILTVNMTSCDVLYIFMVAYLFKFK